MILVRRVLFLIIVTIGLVVFSQAAQVDDSAYQDAFVAFQSKNFDQADLSCDQALLANPKDPRATILKGRIAAARGNVTAAETLLKHGLELDPNSPSGHRAIGDFFFHQRRYQDARLAYLDAQRYGKPGEDKDLPLMLFYCDIGLQNLGEAERVAATFNSFDETTPAYYFAQAALARVKGNEAASKKALQDATVLYGSMLFGHYAGDYFFLFATKP